MDEPVRISTGIDGLDRAVDYLRSGDTVLWQIEHTVFLVVERGNGHGLYDTVAAGQSGFLPETWRTSFLYSPFPFPYTIRPQRVAL